MFIGHFAVAFAAKRATPRTSLGTTFVAAQLADLLWPIFLLLGWERVRVTSSANPFLILDFTHYPWSHSLLMGVVWGVALGALYFAVTRNGRGAVIVGLLVPSHWVLDLFVHVPDLPLYPGGTERFGLGLWRNPLATIIVEIVVFIAGVAVYARATRARDRIGRYGFWALVTFLVLMYAASTVSPPPPSERALAWTTLIGWPLTLWPWWVDRHRDASVSNTG
jgi:LexA-binding, inner membrane-associated putative hydrolase